MDFDALFNPPANPIADLPSDKLERAMALRNGLVALCEGRTNMNDGVYRLLRREFMADQAVSGLVPTFVRTAQDTGAMWAFLKDNSPQWAPRRQYVRDAFADLIDALEHVPAPIASIPARLVEQRVASHPRERPMYNLFVSGDGEAWNGEPWTIDAARCIAGNECTQEALVRDFGSLEADAIQTLKGFPCLFAYEAGHRKAPRFGTIRDVIRRQGQVRIEYDLLPLDPGLSAERLQALLFELDIGKWELNRSHWALKDVDLAKELRAHGIVLPDWKGGRARMVDISRHPFDVALSFPGEVRPLVKEVAAHLERLLGPHTYFYDNNYVSQLARPSLDVFLQGIYRHRAKLIVVFLSSDYQRKDWCGIEFRAIRDIIAERRNDRIMFVRTDDGMVDGVFKTDGYVDARIFPAAEIARFIGERVEFL